MALKFVLIYCSLLLSIKCATQDTDLTNVDGDDLAQLFEGEESPLLCNHIGHSNNVTLRGGINSGKFTKRENTTTFDDCIEECCRDQKCDVAFELGKACYSVYCFTAKLCEVIPNTNPSSTGSVRIAQVIHNASNATNTTTGVQTDLGAVQPTPNPKRTKNEKKTKKIIKNVHTDLGINQPTPNPEQTRTGDKHTKKNVKVDSHHNPTIRNAIKLPERQTVRKAYRIPGKIIREKAVNQTINIPTDTPKADNQRTDIPTDTPVTKQGMTEKLTPASIQTFKPVPKETKKPAITETTKKQSSKQTVQPNKPLVKQTGLPTPATQQTQATLQTETSTPDKMAKKNIVPLPRNHLKGNNTCVFSRVAYNQTIVGGTQSWQSIDLGEFIDLHDCAEKCCRTDNCMVAAVREKKCYAVECFEKNYCESKRVEPTVEGDALSALIYMNIINGVRQNVVDMCNAERCVNGICTNDDTCLCDVGVTGAHCDVGETVGKCDPPCGPHGQCNSFDRCTCRPGWEGYKCDRQIICHPPCRNGICVDSERHRCECRIGWSGKHCNKTTGDKSVLASTGEQVLFTHIEIEPELAIKIPADAPPSSSRAEPVSAIAVASCCGIASMFILIFVVATKTRQNRLLKRQFLEAKKNAINKSKF